MAPILTLYRLVWGGRLFDKESWSCSLHVGSDAGLNLAASMFSAPLVAWANRPASLLSSDAHLDFVKFNRINPLTAKYTDLTTNELLQNDLGKGVATAGPGQNSLCVSTRTAATRGRGHAGRFYPPVGMSGTDAGTGLIGATFVGGTVSSAVTLLRDINAVVGAGSRLVVFSKIGQTVTPITSVRVGRVMDTVRSRRRSLGEDYMGSAL